MKYSILHQWILASSYESDCDGGEHVSTSLNTVELEIDYIITLNVQ